MRSITLDGYDEKSTPYASGGVVAKARIARVFSVMALICCIKNHCRDSNSTAVDVSTSS